MSARVLAIKAVLQMRLNIFFLRFYFGGFVCDFLPSTIQLPYMVIVSDEQGLAPLYVPEESVIRIYIFHAFLLYSEQLQLPLFY